MKVRRLFPMALALLLLLSLAGCAGSSAPMEKDSANVMYDAEMPAQAPEYGLTGEGNSAGISLPQDRKLIRTLRIEAETEDMATLTDLLTERITQLGGYVEEKNLHSGSRYGGYTRRTLSMTVRIPADQADAFVEQVSAQANIVSSGETVEDVTLQYVDTESQVKALETEQARLLELLEQAANLQEILEIEARLTDVRYELERFASRLRTLDNQIDYATIHLSVTEVKEYTPVVEEETLWQRISGGFARSLKDIGKGITEGFVWVAVNSPYLLIWGVIGAGVLILARKRLGGRKKKAAPPSEKTE